MISEPSKCKVCTSKNRSEVDKRLADGDSSESVAEWLITKGESYSAGALRRHRQKHVRPTEEAKAILAERQAPIRAAALAIVEDADTLAEVAEIGLTVARALRPRMTDPFDKRSLADVTLFNGALREAREAAVARHEVLNGKKVNVDARLSGGLAGLFAELDRKDIE